MRNYIIYILAVSKTIFNKHFFPGYIHVVTVFNFFFFILIIENPNNLMMSSENEICGVREIHCIKIFSIRQILLDHDR
jgi:hypothetical protein